MKAKCLSLVLVMVLVVSLFGCGVEETSTSVDPSETEKATTISEITTTEEESTNEEITTVEETTESTTIATTPVTVITTATLPNTTTRATTTSRATTGGTTQAKTTSTARATTRNQNEIRLDDYLLRTEKITVQESYSGGGGNYTITYHRVSQRPIVNGVDRKGRTWHSSFTVSATEIQRRLGNKVAVTSDYNGKLPTLVSWNDPSITLFGIKIGDSLRQAERIIEQKFNIDGSFIKFNPQNYYTDEATARSMICPYGDYFFRSDIQPYGTERKRTNFDGGHVFDFDYSNAIYDTGYNIYLDVTNNIIRGIAIGVDSPEGRLGWE